MTSNWSWKAVELEVEYHKYQGVTPGEDHQFNHHMETLTRSLVHDGRFADALKIKTMAEGSKYNFRPEWLRMAIGQRDWDGAQKLIEQFRRTDKSTGAYYAALVSLEKGDTEQAGREIDSDFEPASLLVSSGDQLTADDATRKAYLDAARSIDSDFELRRVLPAGQFARSRMATRS